MYPLPLLLDTAIKLTFIGQVQAAEINEPGRRQRTTVRQGSDVQPDTKSQSTLHCKQGMY